MQIHWFRIEDWGFLGHGYTGACYVTPVENIKLQLHTQDTNIAAGPTPELEGRRLVLATGHPGLNLRAHSATCHLELPGLSDDPHDLYYIMSGLMQLVRHSCRQTHS